MTYQPFDLTGKTVLITGGNRGIGLGMATAIANAGANLAIWGTNEERNQQALETLSKAGSGKMQAWKINVAEEDQVETGFAEVLEHFGRVDSTFANAGIGNLAGTFADMDTKAYREVLAVNLDGAFFTLRVAARHMVARAKDGDPGGSLVGVASLAATEGAARNQHYSASKAGLTGIIRGIAVEYGRYGIRANSVLPGWIATDMTAGAQGNDKFADKVITRVPAGRWGEPEDFGGIAVYLASDASAFHSGDLFKIDGGYSVF